MSGPFKLKYSNSAFPFKTDNGKVTTDTHWPDGTKKSKRDKFHDAETKAEIEKEEKAYISRSNEERNKLIKKMEKKNLKTL